MLLYLFGHEEELGSQLVSLVLLEENIKKKK
jgi:hypothetical protein